MKRIIWGTAFTVTVLTVAAFGGINTKDPAAATAARVERGHHLVESIGLSGLSHAKEDGAERP
jgi:hypothetical protein